MAELQGSLHSDGLLVGIVRIINLRTSPSLRSVPIQLTTYGRFMNAYFAGNLFLAHVGFR